MHTVGIGGVGRGVGRVGRRIGGVGIYEGLIGERNRGTDGLIKEGICGWLMWDRDR